MLVFENVYVTYEKSMVLRDVSLKVEHGEIVTLIGANGAGKSTLLMSIFGCPAIQQGNIFFEGQSVHTIPTHHIASLGIAIAPERRRIFEKLTVDENLKMGALFRKPKKTTRDFILSLFPILADRQHQYAGTLSGGEQQMLAIGRALMSEPTLLLLDEPSLGLSPKKVQEIFSALKQIANEGKTLFLVEQNAYQALHLAQRGYVLVKGRIKLSGNTEDLIKNPKVQSFYFG